MDPLNADSDGDTLNDGDELEIGLDPNNPETFGIPDVEYKVNQTISADSKALANVNTEESPYELSIEVIASGNVNGHLDAGRSSYSAVINSNIQLGESIDLNYMCGDVDEVKLHFTIGDIYLENELNIFPDEEELQGIKRLNIFKYFEDINMLLPIETVIDEETNTISATVDELGTYCVVDMEKWFKNILGIEIPQEIDFLSGEEEFRIAVDADSDFSEEETRVLKVFGNLESDEAYDDTDVTPIIAQPTVLSTSTVVTGLTPVEVGTPIDVVFLLQTAGESEYYFNSQSTMIVNVMENLQKSYGKNNVRLCVITYNLSGAKFLSSYSWFTNSDELRNALSNITYSYTNSYVNRGAAFSKLISDVSFKKAASKFVFQVMNGATTVGSGYFSQLDACSQLLINYSELMPSGYYYVDSGYAKSVANAIAKTGGVNLTFSATKSTTDVYNHICANVAPPRTEYEALIPTGWSKIKLNGILDPDNGIDSDGDGLTDWEEVDNERIGFNSDSSVILPTIQECIDFAEKPYSEEGLTRFKSSCWAPGMPSSEYESYIAYVLRTKYVLPIFSNPKDEDSDGDGYPDGPIDVFRNGKTSDPHPLKKDVFTYKLEKSDTYVSVNGSYGGNQSWIDSYGYPNKEIYDSGGCGIAAACDFMIYLERTNSTLYAGLTGIPDVNNITMDQYVEFFYHIGSNYVKPIEFLGAKEYLEQIIESSGYDITYALAIQLYALLKFATDCTYTWGIMPWDYPQYINDACSSINVQHIDLAGINVISEFELWNAIFSLDFERIVRSNFIEPALQNLLVEKIKNSLSKNCPVTLCYGINSEYTFYTDTKCTSPYGKEIRNAPHYVNITEYIIDTIADEEYITISSWGKRLYIDPKQIFQGHGIGGSLLFYAT